MNPLSEAQPGVVFGLLQDLVIEEAERSPYGLVVREEGSEIG